MIQGGKLSDGTDSTSPALSPGEGSRVCVVGREPGLDLVEAVCTWLNLSFYERN